MEGETKLGWLESLQNLEWTDGEDYQVSGLSTTREPGSPNAGLEASFTSWRLAAEEAQFTLTAGLRGCVTFTTSLLPSTWPLVDLFGETPQIQSAVKCLGFVLSLYSKVLTAWLLVCPSRLCTPCGQGPQCLSSEPVPPRDRETNV